MQERVRSAVNNKSIFVDLVRSAISDQVIKQLARDVRTSLEFGGRSPVDFHAAIIRFKEGHELDLTFEDIEGITSLIISADPPQAAATDAQIAAALLLLVWQLRNPKYPRTGRLSACVLLGAGSNSRGGAGSGALAVCCLLALVAESAGEQLVEEPYCLPAIALSCTLQYSMIICRQLGVPPDNLESMNIAVAQRAQEMITDAMAALPELERWLVTFKQLLSQDQV
jgi:hypothetical protein